jgi:Zn-dependent protease with chaperone function
MKPPHITTIGFKGIPVRYDESFPNLAVARGFWPNKYIVVGPLFCRMTPRQQVAVLTHEEHHCRRLHLEQRLLVLALICVPALWLLTTREIAALLLTAGMVIFAEWLSHRHEFNADKLAHEHGYGVEFIEILMAMGAHDGSNDPFHPSHKDRIAHLQQLMKE